MTIGIGQIISRGLDGLNVNQRGLAVTSNNIANLNTQGYARQQIIIGAGFGNAGGAQVLAVNEVVSPFVELQLFTTSNAFGLADGRRQAVAQVEEMFNESQNGGLGKELGEFFNAFSALANDASSMIARQNVKDSASRLISRFNTLQRQLNQMRSDVSSEIGQRVTLINSLSSQIADLNGQITSAEGEEARAALRGQRRELLRQLSEEVNVSYFEQDDNLQISINGAASLVNGTNAGTLSLTNDISLGGTMSVSLAIAGGAQAQDITSHVDGGRLGGNILERNTTLNDRLDELDELAFTIVQQVNTAHAAGYTLDSATGVNFFEPLGGQEGAARYIALDSSITTSLRNIAAAAADPATSGVGDNGNALDLADLQNQLTMTSGSQTFLQFYQEMVGSIGSAAATVRNDYEIQSNLLSNLQLQREAVSGVNLDEEGANIIRYQRAFQASSRLILMADELIQSILQI